MKNWFQRLIRRRHPSSNGERPEDGIGADAPIRSAAQDRLRRASFAARIATILSGPSLEEGRVFAIRGAWGDGKSSLKNLVIEQLEARADDMRWLDFNPWQWGDGDIIARALFRQMADKLGGGGGLSAAAIRRAKLLRHYGTLLTSAGKPLHQVSGNVQIISSVLTSASVLALAGAFGLTMPPAAAIAALLAVVGIGIPVLGYGLAALGRDRWSAPLDEIRDALERSLRKLDRPLIVFIDDIDRLEPDQIRLLFRQVKVNANLPNIVFVMLFQSSIVESALDPIADQEGRAFLEKIVQANFDLPSVPASVVHAGMTQELSVIAAAYATAENGFEEVRWGNLLVGCIQRYVRNLRDARRYLSSVAIHLPLHAGRTAFEVNILDFLALEALRVFEPDLHSALFSERDLLLQARRFGGDGRDDEHRKRAEALVSRVPEERREMIRAAFKELFPRLGWAFGGTYYSDGQWDERWIGEKRVCTARFFARYFELQTPEGELSQSEFADVVSASVDPEQLKAVLEDLHERGLTPSLAARLDESVNSLPPENASILLPAMYQIAQSLVARGPADPFNSPWVSAWRAISWYLKLLPSAKRGALMLDALRQTGALSVTAILIHLNSPDDDEGDRVEPDIDAATVQALKDEWLIQIAKFAREGGLLAAPDLASLLFRWRDYSGGLGLPRGWVTEAIKSDAGFATVVTSIMSTGTSHSFGDRVASRIYMFDRDTVEAFFNMAELERRVSVIDSARLSPDQAHALGVLRDHLNRWRSTENEP